MEHVQKLTAKGAKAFSKFFEIHLTIKVFGYSIYELHYPPQSKLVEDADYKEITNE